MAKAMLKLGYDEYVLEMTDALKVFQLLNAATVYKRSSKWVKDEETNKSFTVYSVKQYNEDVSVCGVTNEDFAVWQLAGASE